MGLMNKGERLIEGMNPDVLWNIRDVAEMDELVGQGNPLDDDDCDEYGFELQGEKGTPEARVQKAFKSVPWTQLADFLNPTSTIDPSKPDHVALLVAPGMRDQVSRRSMDGIALHLYDLLRTPPPRTTLEAYIIRMHENPGVEIPSLSPIQPLLKLTESTDYEPPERSMGKNDVGKIVPVTATSQRDMVHGLLTDASMRSQSDGVTKLTRTIWAAAEAKKNEITGLTSTINPKRLSQIHTQLVVGPLHNLFGKCLGAIKDGRTNELALTEDEARALSLFGASEAFDEVFDTLLLYQTWDMREAKTELSAREKPLQMGTVYGEEIVTLPLVDTGFGHIPGEYDYNYRLRTHIDQRAKKRETNQ